jgi:hypothetical protein
MIYDVTYVVNTHSNYAIPVEVLMDSMIPIRASEILIVIADGGEDSITCMGNGMRIMRVKHNSFDYTGAIAIIAENIPTADHVMFIQDTMQFGLNTDKLVRIARDDVPATAAFGGQCNLVLYRRDYLEKQQKYIFERRNLSKLDSIMHEGTLWKMTTEKASYPNGTMEVLGTGNPYGGATRIKEYYAALDIIKWKANYGQNMNNLILHP